MSKPSQFLRDYGSFFPIIEAECTKASVKLLAIAVHCTIVVRYIKRKSDIAGLQATCTKGNEWSFRAVIQGGPLWVGILTAYSNF